jgi:hypothetical protein
VIGNVRLKGVRAYAGDETIWEREFLRRWAEKRGLEGLERVEVWWVTRSTAEFVNSCWREDRRPECRIN